MRIIPYIRVSTEEQAKSGLGLEAQIEAIRREATHRGLPVSDPFGDPGKSGDLPLEKRGGLIASIKSLRRGDILMVAKLDRLSRCGVADTLAIEAAVRKRGARIVSAAGEGTEPKDKYDVSAHTQRDMIGLFSSMEKRNTAARTHVALQAKRARGTLAGHVPFGFTTTVVDGTTKRGLPARALVPVPSEQRAVESIVALRLQGLGLRRICNRLEACGIKARGPRWHPETVRSILAQVKDHPEAYTASRFLSPSAQRATAVPAGDGTGVHGSKST